MKTIISSSERWAIQFRSNNQLDGYRSFLMCGDDCNVVLFSTREEARKYNQTRYGYIKDRADLKKEPHGWKMPRVVKVQVDYCL